MNEHRDWMARLYQVHHAEIARYLTRVLRSAPTAEDLLHETFIRVQRLEPTRVRNPRSLLYSIASNLVLSHIRRVQNEPVIFSRDDEISDAADRSALPSEIAQVDEALCLLDHALQRLPRRLSEVWMMRWVAERSREDIAQDLTLTLDAVDQRLTRAMLALRRQLLKAGFNGLD